MDFDVTNHCSFACTCDHHAPSERILRSPEFNQALATYWRDRNKSIPAIYDDILSELFDHYRGRLIVKGKVVDLYEVDAEGNDWIDRAFGGGDVYRALHRYFERAGGGFKNRLQCSLILPVLVMHLSRDIAECRAQDKCACRNQPSE